MAERGIIIDQLPALRDPFLIAGFGGWGNALDVSNSMAAYLVRQLGGECFAKLNSDSFYRYDESRPHVDIDGGILKSVIPPGGSFYAVHKHPQSRDLVILKAAEPTLRWYQFVDEMLTLCEKLGTSTIITLGSMYDNVLHSDKIISGISSDGVLMSKLQEQNVTPINYQGPSAIHSTIHSEGQRRGFRCVSLWCHCPYYLQGTTHYGLLSHLGGMLSYLGEFDLDVQELDANWRELSRQIQDLIEENPDFQAMIQKLRKAKVQGSLGTMKDSGKKDEKVIDLRDFLKPL
jgi:proteasome assembly chaperone (PAC2) family protein